MLKRVIFLTILPKTLNYFFTKVMYFDNQTCAVQSDDFIQLSPFHRNKNRNFGGCASTLNLRMFYRYKIPLSISHVLKVDRKSSTQFRMVTNYDVFWIFGLPRILYFCVNGAGLVGKYTIFDQIFVHVSF